MAKGIIPTEGNIIFDLTDGKPLNICGHRFRQSIVLGNTIKIWAKKKGDNRAFAHIIINKNGIVRVDTVLVQQFGISSQVMDKIFEELEVFGNHTINAKKLQSFRNKK